jgi:hypothetical protein
MMAHEFSAKNFTYYGDKEGQQVLNTDQLGYRNGFNARIAAAEDVWWATQAEHATHCLFLFMRFHGVVTETVENGGELSDLRLDSLARDINHVRHCVQNILNLLEKHAPNWDKILTRGTSRFFGC